MSFTPPYDLFSAQFKADPFPTYAHLRTHDPVYGSVGRNGKTVWFITRYEDVLDVLKDTERFVKDTASIGRDPAQLKPRQQSGINTNMLFSDPPEHTRLRDIVNLAFTPKRIEGMQEHVERVCHQFIDQVASERKMELIEQFALPYPTVVISDLLGIPAKDRTQVMEWSQMIISPGARRQEAKERKKQLRLFVEYLNDLFNQRRADPQNDLITALVSEENEERLDAAELSSMVSLLLVTGHETTVNQIGNAIHALLAHRDQWDLLRDDVTLVPNAIEELLRFDGPVETSTTRWVRKDITYGGQSLHEGDVVRAVIASAGRDANWHENPDVLDITRPNPKHLQFGIGIHYCLGSTLARLESQIALKILLERCPHLDFAIPTDQLQWRKGVLFRGLHELPVTW